MTCIVEIDERTQIITLLSSLTDPWLAYTIDCFCFPVSVVFIIIWITIIP